MFRLKCLRLPALTIVVVLATFARAQNRWSDVPPAPQAATPETSNSASNSARRVTPIAAAGPVANATTSEDTAEAFGQRTERSLNEAKGKMLAALQGDTQSQVDLATKYLVPIVLLILVGLAANWAGTYLGAVVATLVSVQVDATIGKFAGKLTKAVILLIALMAVLGPRAASLAGIIAAIGFAVGMALQGTLGNFAAGIALLVFRPFRVGDFIIVDGESGTVNSIELFTTTIDTPDNRHIIIPNDRVFGNKIVNYTHNSARRVEVIVGVSYSADTAHTREVLLDALDSLPGRLAAHPAEAYLAELGGSSVDWSCRVWCRPADYLAVKERVTEGVKIALERNGIGIPYPQLDLHVVTPGSQRRAAA